MSKTVLLEPEFVKQTKDKIHELIHTLPAVEQNKYELVLMAMELREELAALIKRNDGTVSQVESDIQKVKKKREALDDLIALEEVFKKLLSNLNEEEAEQLSMQGRGLKTRLQNKANKRLDEQRADKSDDKGEDTNNVQ